MSSLVLQLFLNSLVAAALYSLIALGFNLIYGTTKFFNLAHGTIAIIGGYIFYLMTLVIGRPLPIWIALVAGVLGAGLAGYATEKFVYAPLRARRASGMVLLVAALGLSTALQAIIAIIFTSQFQTFSNLIEQHIFSIGDAAITNVQIVMIAWALVCVVVVALIHKFTAFGKAVTAVSDDEEVAKIVGISTGSIIAKTFFLGSAIAGSAGILMGFDTGIEPTVGLNLLLKGVIAAIIGGMGNIWGGVLGALLLGLAENFGILKISSEWKDAIAFGVLLVFLLFRPQGILRR